MLHFLHHFLASRAIKALSSMMWPSSEGNASVMDIYIWMAQELTGTAREGRGGEGREEFLPNHLWAVHQLTKCSIEA